MNADQVQTQTDLIYQCVSLVQKLRHGVGQVFKDLSDGVSDYVEDTADKEDTDSAGSKADSTKDKTSSQKDVPGIDKEESQEKHRAILRTLKKSLETISHDFRLLAVFLFLCLTHYVPSASSSGRLLYQIGPFFLHLLDLCLLMTTNATTILVIAT